jgi:hypothetical protein
MTTTTTKRSYVNVLVQMVGGDQVERSQGNDLHLLNIGDRRVAAFV